MRFAAPLSPCVWKGLSVFRFTFPRLVSWGLCWRAAWLAIAIAFATQNYRAELLLASMMDGKPHSAEWWFNRSLETIQTFPFERHLRWQAVGVLRVVAARLKAEYPKLGH